MVLIAKKIRRRGKKVHSVKFADGQIFTILDIEPNPQSGDVTLYLKKNVGAEFLLIPMLLGLGLFLGYMTYKLPGAIIGVTASGLSSLGLFSQFQFGKMVERTLPQSAIIGFDNYFQLKSKNYTFCVHSFDSLGNSVASGSDPIVILERQINERDWQIKFLRDEINTLRFSLTQKQVSEKEVVDEIARRLDRILEASVTKVRTVRERVPTEYGIPPEMLGRTEEGGEENE